MLIATIVLVVSTVNIVAVYYDLSKRCAHFVCLLLNPMSGFSGSANISMEGLPSSKDDLVESPDEEKRESGCSALQGDDRDACIEERQARERARERKAAKVREQEALLEQYKKKRRAEKKLKVQQQQEEHERQGKQQAQEVSYDFADHPRTTRKCKTQQRACLDHDNTLKCPLQYPLSRMV
eukprot:1195342-Prorocentrum_minimum.AAC.7